MERNTLKCIYRMSWLAQDPANASSWTLRLHHVTNRIRHDRREIVEDGFASIIRAIKLGQEKILDDLNIVLVIYRVTKES